MIREVDLGKCADSNVVFLRNSLELWEESKKVSDSIEPILFYYSWQQFAAFFIYTLFRWSEPSKGHGVACSFGDMDSNGVDAVLVEFRERGFFRRLVHTFVVLGHPTAFGQWVPLGSPHGLMFAENGVRSRIPIGRLKLVNIMDFSSREFARDFSEMYPNSYYGSHVDDHLTDYLLTYVASSIARYRPKIWQDILAGRGRNEARFRLLVERAHERYASGFTCFLETVWSEFVKWNRSWLRS